MMLKNNIILIYLKLYRFGIENNNFFAGKKFNEFFTEVQIT